jgi:hypothetical protein
VKPRRPRIELAGPARFFLHDTYSQPLIIIRKRNPDGELVLQDVYAYGVYVIGCQVLTSDRKWHSLEFDLASLMQLPVEIRKR